MSKDTSNPAYPGPWIDPESSRHTGMTKRQEYKKAAITGLLANSALYDKLMGGKPGPGVLAASMASVAADIADAMLEEDEDGQ